MENAHASGMIQMFLSGSTARGRAREEMEPELPVKLRSRRILLACSGTDLVLSGAAKKMAFGFGRNNAGTRIFNITNGSRPAQPKNLTGYDGILIGVSPDGSGSADRAFSFIRKNFDALSSRPLALFFILSRPPEQEACDTRLEELSRLCPLDTRSFNRSSPDISAGIADWALNTVWPLMETRWLADIIFPEPAAESDTVREQPRAMASLY